MADSICLDTDILIDFLRNDLQTVEWIKNNENKVILATTVINLFELYAGANKVKNSREKIIAVDKLAERLQVLNFSIEVSKEAGMQKAFLEQNGNDLDIRDLFIGIISKSQNFSLKTNNKRHFSKISGLKLAE